MLNQDIFFDGLGFEKIYIGNTVCYKGPDGLFYRIDQGKTFVAIECADNEDEAKRDIFDDADLFDIKVLNQDVIDLIREELKQLVTC